MNRRTFMVGAASVGTATIVGCNQLSPAEEASATMQAESDGSSIEVTTPDGTVESIRVFVNVILEYSGWTDQEIDHAGFTTELNGEAVHSGDFSFEHPDLQTGPTDDMGPDEGSIRYFPFFDRIGSNHGVFLFDDTSYSQEDFEVGTPGETETHEIPVDVEGRLLAGEDNVVWSDSVSTSLSITITHEEDDNGGGGEASMGIDSVDIIVELPDGDTVTS